MNESTAALAAPRRLSPRLDHDAWVNHLRAGLVLDGEWRPLEFDPEQWLFTGDPDNPMTTSARCRAPYCHQVVTSRCLCGSCRDALVASGLSEKEFLATFRPPSSRLRPLTGEACGVSRGRCRRRRISNRTGLCQSHTSQWHRRGKLTGLILTQWCTEVARPLPARESCSVPGCGADSRLEVRLCATHIRVWRASQNRLPSSQRENAESWAAREPARLRVHQFSLLAVHPTVRYELLYALQRRDAQGQKLDPVAMRSLVAALTDVDALATTPYAEVEQRIGKARNVHAHARLLVRIIHLKFEEFRGIAHTDKDVWDCLALDLKAPRPHRRPNLSSVDFTPIRQQWLKDATKHWGATLGSDPTTLKRTLQAATLASQALARRPGGGDDPSDLGFADVTAIFEAIKTATQANGELYKSRYRRGLWARFWTVIDLARKSELLAELPGTFSRYSSHTIGHEEGNEDEIGKAIPETVIAQLDAHLDLLEANRTYGRLWSPTDTAAMFKAAYVVLRDTGRRPQEVVSLPVDCLEADGGEYALVYDNRKGGRLRRRLPITAESAAAIQQWQHHRAGLLLPASTKPWLFPAPNESSGPGHLTTTRLATALRRWVAAIPVLNGELPGKDGAPLPFDRTLIYPYAFRHSYAQRHADAGVGVEVLKELMDHKDLSVTQGYYTVTLKRKREAIKIMSRYVHDRTGAPCAGSGSATGYELRSVAVPFGNCIEPTNVKAGGKQCPIRFQCAGCGFYRPDPSYLPAIEEHINALRADRETALAIDADDFVVRNVTDQADAFSRIAETMRDKLSSLPDPERAEVEQASAILRKVRVGRDVDGGRKLLPLIVKERP
ncbi:MAG: tyrosine-type recombinase/integrase [Candidatus Limnocylindria bacterium]